MGASSQSPSESESRSQSRPPLCAPLTFASVALLTLASRLPFLAAGYGSDWDAWRMAAASREIAASGVYVASRLPGHPLPELIGALIRGGGPLALNGAVALASALAAGFFSLSWRALGGRSPLAAGLALAFTPVVFVHSVDAMDHVWALAFLMAALFGAISRRPLAAGRPGALRTDSLGLTARRSSATACQAIVPIGERSRRTASDVHGASGVS